MHRRRNPNRKVKEVGERPVCHEGVPEGMLERTGVRMLT